MASSLPHRVPLGLTGKVTVARAKYMARAEREPHPGRDVLLDEPSRIVFIASYIDVWLDNLAEVNERGQALRTELRTLPGAVLLPKLAEKTLEALRTGKPTRSVAVSTRNPATVLLFNAWSSSRAAAHPLRKGQYLTQMIHAGRMAIEKGIPIAGVVDLAIYAEELIDLENPHKPVDEVMSLDLEPAYLPGAMIGGPGGGTPPLDKTIWMNPELCSELEMNALKKWT